MQPIQCASNGVPVLQVHSTLGSTPNLVISGAYPSSRMKQPKKGVPFTLVGTSVSKPAMRRIAPTTPGLAGLFSLSWQKTNEQSSPRVCSKETRLQMGAPFTCTRAQGLTSSPTVSSATTLQVSRKTVSTRYICYLIAQNVRAAYR